MKEKSAEKLFSLSNLREIEVQLALIFRLPPKLKPSDWAEEHRRLSPEASVTGGRWRNLPMQVEPMDSVIDPQVRSTVLMFSSQTAGKTEIVNNVVGYFCDQDPSPILVLQPTLDMAETWSKDRFSTMVRDTPCLANIFSDQRRKVTGNTILHKTFPGGHLTVAGANSPASLASRPIRVNVFDEEDRYPESAGTEGDPVLLAEKRSDTYWNAVNLKTSTPTIKGHSRIEKDFELSDQRFWFVPCPYCEHEQKLKWSNVKWDDKDRLEETYYVCENPECHEKWSDLQRIAAIRAGRWVATAPFTGVRGYHLNGIYSLFRAKKGFVNRLHQMAVEFITAKALGKDSFKVWVNTFLSETWEEASDVKPDWKKLFERREKYTEQVIPLGVRIITAGLDFQGDRIELEFVGHGVGEESWGLGHHQIWGDPKLPEIYQRLEATLNREFVREDKARLTLRAAGFDTGYHACQRQLYAYLRPRLGRRYFAFKGNNQKNAEPIAVGAKSRVEAVKLILVGTNRIKTYIYARCSITAPGPGYLHFPESYTQEWFKQLLVEEAHTEYQNGMAFKVFIMPTIQEEGSTERNEALDMRVYAMGALYAHGVVNWEYEEKRNLATIPPEDGAPRQLSPREQRRARRPRRSSLIDGLLAA